MLLLPQPGLSSRYSYDLDLIIIPDVAADIPFRFAKRCVAFSRHPFGLKAAKEALHRSIIPTVSAPTPSLLNLMMRQLLPEHLACVMTALVRVKHHTLWTASRFIRCAAPRIVSCESGLVEYDQPIILRLSRSRTTARYNQHCPDHT